MPRVRPFQRFQRAKPLTKEFADPSMFAIEKIENRINKDVRASGATFGILQHIDKAKQDIGRLRRRAMNDDRYYFDAKRQAQRGQTNTFPGVSGMGQRDVRQLRSHKPGVVPRAEGFK
jgi:hypothetical protein